jgi:hypothetical protein
MREDGLTIGYVLWRDGVEQFAPDRYTHLCQIAQELTGSSKAFVDVEGTIDVWVVDETFPSHSCAWFLATESW